MKNKININSKKIYMKERKKLKEGGKTKRTPVKG